MDFESRMAQSEGISFALLDVSASGLRNRLPVSPVAYATGSLCSGLRPKYKVCVLACGR